MYTKSINTMFIKNITNIKNISKFIRLSNKMFKN